MSTTTPKAAGAKSAAPTKAAAPAAKAKAAPAAQPSSSQREYVVLIAGLSGDVVGPCFGEEQDSGTLVWHIAGRATALTNKQAIEMVVGTLPADEQEGTFIAVPVRSWVPLTRKTQTVTKALWS